MKTAVFTIASRNYFAFVRTLMYSLEKSNPEWERYVVVVDEICSEFSELPRNFQLISIDELDLPEREKMVFRYTIMELNTAVKPFAIEKLFIEKDYERVVYIDPDIYVYEKMLEVEKALDDGYNFVLTPHFTGIWKEDGKMPDEPAIMRSGVYNLGFIALNKAETTMEMIHWWEEKLEKQCIVDVANGIFVDQKWIDLVPGRYSDVFILRHEGYNVAYWNLMHRKVKKSGEKYFFNNQPLIFFHFSGLNPRDLASLSKHQDRFYLHNMGETSEIVKEYAKCVLGNDFDFWKKYQYAFGTFTDGYEINDLFRYVYRSNEEIQRACSNNPYEASDVFYVTHKNEITAFLVDYLWKNRMDLQIAFPKGVNSEEYLDWFRKGCIIDYHLPKDYFDGVVIAGKSYVKWKTKWKMKLYNFLPEKIWNIGKKIYRKMKAFRAYPINTKEHSKDDSEGLRKGVNLVGYISSEHGIGEACRLTAECLNTMNIEWSIYDFELNNPSRRNDTTWIHKVRRNIDYNISIFNINADQMRVAKDNTPQKLWNGYKIGIWYWELMEFPDEWCEAFSLVDEIWAPTVFVAEALQKKATCPVFHMPPGIIRVEPESEFDRTYFNLPTSSFLFLNMFDSFSFSGRKNPKATVDAFKNAFDKSDMSVGLVIKLNNANEDAVKEVEDLIEDYNNIYIIPKILERKEVNALISVCDVAVSLHRSEGLGLLCEEAMYYGRAVIATNWSGNTDFMTSTSACMVDYKLKEIGKDIGPYKSWQKWAEPDINQAAGYMVRLKNDTEFYNMICNNAKEYISKNFSPKVCGDKMYKRICEIEEMLDENMKSE